MGLTKLASESTPNLSSLPWHLEIPLPIWREISLDAVALAVATQEVRGVLR